METVHCQDEAAPARQSRGDLSNSQHLLSPSSDTADENRPPVNIPCENMPAAIDENAKVGTALFDRNRGPRPPIPGEETTPPCLDGGCGRASGRTSPPPPPPPLDPWKKKQLMRGLELSKPASALLPSTAPVVVQSEPTDCSTDRSEAESSRTSRSGSPSNRSDSSSTSSSASSLRGRPPALEWANSLQSLLTDREGVDLFEEFLSQEQCSKDELQFWAASHGALKLDSTQQDFHLEKACRIIAKLYVSSKRVIVSDDLSRAVTEMLRKEQTPAAAQMWKELIARAQREVEETITRSTYANFLESDLYLQAVTNQIERRRRKKIEREERKRNKLLGRTGAKSAIPSLPSKLATSVAQPDTSSIPVPVGENEILPEERKFFSAQSAPLTKAALMASMSDRLAFPRQSDTNRPISPHDANGLRSGASASSLGLATPSGGPLHPYHAMYKSYLPVSRQDSELQSLSSDALTDDTLSTLTDDCSSVDGVGGRGPGCSGPCCVKPGPLKHGLGSAPQLRYGSYGGERPSSTGVHLHAGKQAKWQKRFKRQMRLNAEVNKESVRVTETYFIPRTEMPLPKDGTLAEQNPSEFAKLLISKLEEVKQMLDNASKVAADDCRQPGAPALTGLPLPPSILQEAILKAGGLDSFDSDQSILDNHVNRVWADSGQQTPRTPPAPAKRPSLASAPGLLPFGAPLGGARVASRPPVSGQPYVYAGNGKPPAYQATPGSNPDIYHHGRGHHHRKREKDAVSSLSADSGNVFDSRSSLDGAPGGASAYAGFPKSKSVPEWMVEATQKQLCHLRVGGSSAGGGGATTDSGLSATSADSSNAADGMTLKASERVLSWMIRNERYDTGDHSAAPGGSERGSSHRQSRASSSATATGGPGGVLASQAVSGPAPISASSSHLSALPPQPTSSRSSHRRHISSSGACGRSMSVERGSRLSWKQQYQQHAQEYDGANTSAGLTFGGGASGAGGSSAGSMSDVHFLVQERAKILGCPSGFSSKPRFHTSSGKNFVVVPSGSGEDFKGPWTTVSWVYGDERVPYRSRLPGSHVTLKQFKQLLKKGNYRYFFKKEDTEFDSGVVQEEIADETARLPLWDGQVFATVKPM